MTINDTTTLIAEDESRTLELKKSTGELKDGMQKFRTPRHPALIDELSRL